MHFLNIFDWIKFNQLLDQEPTNMSIEKTLKIIVVGDGGVGKTSLFHCYVNNEKAPTDYIPTVFDK